MANVWDNTANAAAVPQLDTPFDIDVANTTGLNLAIGPGAIIVTGAVVPSTVNGVTLALNDNATNVISLNLAAGTIVNDGAALVQPHAPIYTVITVAGAIISVTDLRTAYYPATSLSLPPAPVTALNMVRVNAGGTAYELRTPAQVLSDIGAAALVGSATQVFSVGASTLGAHATNRDYADARYAAIAGSALQVFSVGAATTGAHAANRDYADGRYAALAGISSQTFSVAPATSATHALRYEQAGISCNFLARVGTIISNVTGDGTAYTIVFGTEVFDVGTGFNPATGVFTAPATGKYQFSGTVEFSGLTAGHIGQIDLVASNRTLNVGLAAYGLNVAGYRANFSCMVDMDVGDTASVRTIISSGAKVVDIDTASWFSGVLVG